VLSVSSLDQDRKKTRFKEEPIGSFRTRKYRECGITPGLELYSNVCLKKKYFVQFFGVIN